MDSFEAFPYTSYTNLPIFLTGLLYITRAKKHLCLFKKKFSFILEETDAVNRCYRNEPFSFASPILILDNAKGRFFKCSERTGVGGKIRVRDVKFKEFRLRNCVGAKACSMTFERLQD